jgi:hypothetical protein
MILVLIGEVRVIWVMNMECPTGIGSFACQQESFAGLPYVKPHLLIRGGFVVGALSATILLSYEALLYMD